MSNERQRDSCGRCPASGIAEEGSARDCESVDRAPVVALHGAAEIAWNRPDPRLAVTDPALYKALSDGVTDFFLKGYAVLNREKLAAEAAAVLLRRGGS